MTTINTITSATTPTDYEKLTAIFDKVAHGVGLTALENSFLDQSAKATPSLSDWAWSFLSTPEDEESVQSINTLSDRIIKKDIPVSRVFDEAELSLRSCNTPSIRETASFAKLIQSCLSREDIFTSLLSRFRSKYDRDPTRKELISLVEHCNKASAPSIEAAGQMVAQVEYLNFRFDTKGLLEVRYNQQGFLEINEGPVAPLDTHYRQTLTLAQVAEMKDLYEKLSKETPINNLGELLEFNRYYTEQKKQNPELSLKQALASYHPDLVQIFDKYHSGTCIMLSAKFCHELANRGINAQMMGTRALNPWTSLPIPGKEVEVPWYAFSKELKGVDHTDAVCFFKDEKDSENIARFRCSFEKDLEDEVITYTSDRPNGALMELMFNIGESEVPNKVADSSVIGKTRLLGRHKALIKKDETILGVDFLRGNFYFKPTPGVDSLKGLPRNEKGIVSIELSDLANPEARGFYYIDGLKTELSHREALGMILERAGQELYLPEGIEEDLILVAQNAPALMADFLLQPVPLIKEAHRDLVAIDKKLKSLEKTPSYGALLERYEAEIITAICFNSPDALEKIRSFRAEIEQL